VLELGVRVLNPFAHLLVRYEEVVSPWNVLHNVSLNLFVFQDGYPAVDEDRWLCSLKIRPEICWWSLHVYSRYFQRDRLQLCQKIQVHEILLTKDAGSLSPTIYTGGLDYEFDLWNIDSVDTVRLRHCNSLVVDVAADVVVVVVKL